MAQHTGSLWHDVVKAVTALMRARPGYADPNVFGWQGVPVFHSLEVAVTEVNPDVLLIVGYIGDPDVRPSRGTLARRGRHSEPAAARSGPTSGARWSCRPVT
jgi:hypothetical protein